MSSVRKSVCVGTRLNAAISWRPGELGASYCFAPAAARRRRAPAASDKALHEVSLARMPRYAAPGMTQHIIQRGTNRSVIFVLDSDYRFFLECLREACEKHGCQVHAYVLMTNHVHLLVTPTTTFAIARVMQSVCRRYIRRFNDLHQRTGTLCQGRYRATLVDTEGYLFACHRYIEDNPVRAGLVATPGQYPWSSYRANALGVTDLLVTPHDRYRTLDRGARGRHVAYQTLFRERFPMRRSRTFVTPPTRVGHWAASGSATRSRRSSRVARSRRHKGVVRVGMMKIESDPNASPPPDAAVAAKDCVNAVYVGVTGRGPCARAALPSADRHEVGRTRG